MPATQMAPEIKQRPLARGVLRSQSDDRLVKLARQGRELAFDEIVRRYRTGLVAFAHAYAPSDRAEDVVQESLLSSWDALRESSSEIRLKPWLYAIVRNRALNARRDAKVHQVLDETIDGVRQPGDVVLANEELAEVVSAVRALPDAQREALVRSSLEGHSHEQIAKAIGTSTGGVRQLVFRARSSLRSGLGAMVPLPLVAALASGAGGAAAGTAASVGGGSLATTGATAAAVAAIAVGGGIAIERSVGEDDRGGEASKSAAQELRGEGTGGVGAPERSAEVPTAAATSPPEREQSSGAGSGSGSGDDHSGGPGSSGSSGSGTDAEQAEESREAAEAAAEEARDDARDAAEAAEEAEEQAEEAEEAAREAEEAAADAAEDAEESDSGGSGSSGSNSDSSGSGSSDDPEHPDL